MTMEINSRIRKPSKKTAWVGLQGLYLFALRHFYRKWTLIQGFGNRQKKRRGSASRVYTYLLLDTSIENGHYFTDSETVKKTAWVGLQGLYLFALRHFYRKWTLIQGFGNRQKKRRGSASRVYTYLLLDTSIENGHYFTDSETVKKTAWVGLQGLYSYFLQTLFMEKMEINSWIGNALKKRRWSASRVYIAIFSFDTFVEKINLSRGEINLFLNEFQGFNFNFNSGRCRTYCLFSRFSFLYFGNKHLKIL